MIFITLTNFHCGQHGVTSGSFSVQCTYNGKVQWDTARNHYVGGKTKRPISSSGGQTQSSDWLQDAERHSGWCRKPLLWSKLMPCDYVTHHKKHELLLLSILVSFDHSCETSSDTNQPTASPEWFWHFSLIQDQVRLTATFLSHFQLLVSLPINRKRILIICFSVVESKSPAFKKSLNSKYVSIIRKMYLK